MAVLRRDVRIARPHEEVWEVVGDLGAIASRMPVLSGASR
jgi:carbon monoxide dehydrogenase subunit G